MIFAGWCIDFFGDDVIALVGARCWNGQLTCLRNRLKPDTVHPCLHQESHFFYWPPKLELIEMGVACPSCLQHILWAYLYGFKDKKNGRNYINKSFNCLKKLQLRGPRVAHEVRNPNPSCTNATGRATPASQTRQRPITARVSPPFLRMCLISGAQAGPRTEPMNIFRAERSSRMKFGQYRSCMFAWKEMSSLRCYINLRLQITQYSLTGSCG